jgi:uncharacterized protein (DUF885 family)
MYPSEPFPHFVDDYLAYLHEALPSYAGLDGVHAHDDLLEDLSRQAIDAHVRTLSGFGRRLHQIDPSLLTRVEQVDHPIVAAGIEARMYELEAIRSWERNPQIYAEIIGSSLAGQALFAYAPEAERARRVVSKLRQVPRLVQAARDNIKECPGIFVKVGLESWRGTLRFIESDLPRAFSSLDDLHILGDLADTSTEAATAIKSYLDYLETDLAPRAKASFRLGRDRFEQKLKLEDGVDLSSDRLLAIALRELSAVQEEFRKVAGRLNGGDPIEAWRRAKEQHPAPGQLISVAEAQVAELEEFLRTQDLVSLPDSEPVVVARRPISTGGRSPACGLRGRSKASRAARTTTSLTLTVAGLPIDRRNTCATSISPRCGTFRSTRCIRGISSISAIFGRWNRKCESRRCLRRHHSSKAGRTTAST